MNAINLFLKEREKINKTLPAHCCIKELESGDKQLVNNPVVWEYFAAACSASAKEISNSDAPAIEKGLAKTYLACWLNMMEVAAVQKNNSWPAFCFEQFAQNINKCFELALKGEDISVFEKQIEECVVQNAAYSKFAKCALRTATHISKEIRCTLHL